MMLVSVNDGADGRPKVWLMTACDIALHIMDASGEVAVLLGEVGKAAGLTIPGDVYLVPAPWREIAALLAEHATREGVTLLFAMADHVALAASVTDKQELRDGLLAYTLEEIAHPAGGLRLIQHLQFGPKGLAIVIAEHQAQHATLH